MKKPVKVPSVRSRQRHEPEEAPAEWLAPSKLKPWADNPRAIAETDVERVARSIKVFGFGAPIVARKGTLQIIAGHVRHAAALQLGLERVPVRLLDISEEQAHALAIADNRYVELVSWKPELIGLLDQLDADARELAGWVEKDLIRLREHFIDHKPSEELDPDAIASETFAHTCPQCGCQFNDR